MEPHAREMLPLLADALCYPSPGQLERIEACLADQPPGDRRGAVERFLKKMRGLRLSEREELYTRTFDLNPPAAPYVGYQTWGESYQRGIFLSDMNRALMDAGVETEGELPDHLVPVLRYLGRAADPLPGLVEVFLPALERIQALLRQADSANPYLDVLEAALLATREAVKAAQA